MDGWWVGSLLLQLVMTLQNNLGVVGKIWVFSAIEYIKLKDLGVCIRFGH